MPKLTVCLGKLIVDNNITKTVTETIRKIKKPNAWLLPKAMIKLNITRKKKIHFACAC